MPLEPIAVRVDRALAGSAEEAPRLDREAAFPLAALGRLRIEHLLAAPLPPAFGGDGIGTTPAAARSTLDLLRRIGARNLALGRVFEGHINALRLVLRYGTADQAEAAATDAQAGHLFGIWDAERAETRTVLQDGRLHGQKSFASAAAQVTRAVVTAATPEGPQLLLLDWRAEGRLGAKPDLHGMRGTGTAAVALTDAVILGRIGVPGDYMRQPEISLGAWRTLAVILGGLDALLEAVRIDLRARGRADTPAQQTRWGELLVAHGTARLWVESCAGPAEIDQDEAGANYVKLARVAFEAAALDMVRLAQRAVGLAGFARPHPVERLCRDITTFLRQPGLDEVLTEAAGYFLAGPP